MKKFFNLLLIVLIMAIGITKSNAQVMTFNEALSQNARRPMMVMVYADWAPDAQAALQQFNLAQTKYGRIYNFVLINLADQSAQEYTETFSIRPKLPYILLYRNSSKVAKIIPRECITNSSCFANKIQSFLH